MRTAILLLATVLLACLSSTQVQAGTIFYFNTGADASGNLLPSGSVDPNFELVSSADPNYTTSRVINTYETPYTDYYLHYHGATWIGPRPDARWGNVPGVYVFRLVFDLGDYIPETARISGVWAADNMGNIRLNGIDTGITTPNQFWALTPFSIGTGFIAGRNVVDFVLTNGVAIGWEDLPNPSGLLVSMKVDASHNPEPATYALFASGLLALGFLRRRIR